MTPKPEPAPRAGKKDPVEKLNAQVLKTSEWAAGLERRITAALAGPDAKAAGKVSLRVALEAIGGDVARLRETAELVSRGLHRLHKEKWKPGAGGKQVLSAGDLAAVREGEIKRFDGAWEKADLRALLVVSVHGKKAKCQIAKDGLKGEVIGLVPLRWLQARAA